MMLHLPFSFHVIFIYFSTVAPSFHVNHFHGAVAKTSTNCNGLIFFLKVARDGACLTSSLLLSRKGGDRSVLAFLSSLALRVEFFQTSWKATPRRDHLAICAL